LGASPRIVVDGMRAIRVAGYVALANLVFGVVLAASVLYFKSCESEPHWLAWTTLLLSVITIIGGINRAFADREEGDPALVFSFLLLVPLVVVGNVFVWWLVCCGVGSCHLM
jgi:hypothetical protein